MKKKLTFILALIIISGTALQMSVLAVPAAPDNLTATVNVKSVTLIWNINSNDETGFQIERKEGDGSWELLKTTNAGDNIFRDDEVISGKTYTYRVRAINESVSPVTYSGYSNEASGTIAVVAAPTNLTATAKPGSITLYWADNSDNEEYFLITKAWGPFYGKPGLEPWQDSVSIRVEANKTTYVDTEVESDTDYTYVIMACIDGPAETGIGGLYSGKSNQVTVSLSGSMLNFFPVNPYKPGQFADVSETAWYSNVVALSYHYGLMRGNSANTFNPTGNITIAEAITVATRVHSIYLTGADEFPVVKPGEKWYQANVDYAITSGMIEATDFPDYAKAATRSEMAYIFSRSLSEARFAPENTVFSLPDVNIGDQYGSAIFLLYRAGVLAGNDSIGTFSPDNYITRAEAAAIISRVILPSERSTGRTFG